MPLVPSSFQYTPTVTGQIIAEAVKGACQGKKADNSLGQTVWKTVCEKLYDDYKNMLKTAIMNYVMAAQCQWQPGPPSAITFPPPVLDTFTALAQASGPLIDSQVKSNCQGKKPQQCGAVIWEKVVDQIFKDLVTVLKDAVATMANQGISNVPPGVIAPIHAGTVSPVPATLQIPFASPKMKTELESFFNAGKAKSLGSSIDSEIKNECRSMDSKEQQKQQAGKIWQKLIDKLKQEINDNVPKAIKNFLGGTQNFAITTGDPGTNPAGIPPTLPTTVGLLSTIL